MANLNDIRSRYNYLQYLGLSLVLLVTGCRTGMDGSDSEERSENELLPLESTEPVKRDLAEIKRSEEHTSELQSRGHLVCRLLLDKKNIMYDYILLVSV